MTHSLWRRTLVVSGLIAGLVMLTACAGTDGSETSLEGTGWQVASWTAEEDPAGFELTAYFEDDRVGGRSAVNNYSGPYATSSDGELSVGMVSQTLMAGPEPAMRAETAFLTFLQEADGYERDGDTLRLLRDGEVLVTFERIE